MNEGSTTFYKGEFTVENGEGESSDGNPGPAENSGFCCGYGTFHFGVEADGLRGEISEDQEGTSMVDGVPVTSVHGDKSLEP
jgi:hypothetical protein